MDVFNQLAGYFKPETNVTAVDVHELAMRLASSSLQRREDEGLYVSNSDGSIGLTAEGQMIFDSEYEHYFELVKSFKVK